MTLDFYELVNQTADKFEAEPAEAEPTESTLNEGNTAAGMQGVDSAGESLMAFGAGQVSQGAYDSNQDSRESQVTVNEEAREVLAAQGETYRDSVEQELKESKISLQQLRQAILTVLHYAGSIAREDYPGTSEGPVVIDEQAVRKAMKHHCTYFPWC